MLKICCFNHIKVLFGFYLTERNDIYEIDKILFYITTLNWIKRTKVFSSFKIHCYYASVDRSIHGYFVNVMMAKSISMCFVACIFATKNLKSWSNNKITLKKTQTLISIKRKLDLFLCGNRMSFGQNKFVNFRKDTTFINFIYLYICMCSVAKI